MKENFGALLKEKRVANGITLPVFAEMTGVSSAYISNFEHNRARPTEKVLNLILNELLLTDLDRQQLEELSQLPIKNCQYSTSDTDKITFVVQEIPQVALRIAKNLTSRGKEWDDRYKNDILMKIGEV